MGQMNPADGERRALAGYLPQYTISASLVLKALMQRKLEWVRIADPDAGRVDDFQIGTHNRVDAFQVKWSTFPGLVTWTTLTKDQEDGPSLIRQLADGWQRLRARSPNSRVVVHLVTNELPSRNDGVPVDSAGNTRKHLALFLAQAWNPWRKDRSANIGNVELPWQYAMEQMRLSSGLSEVDFPVFAADCELNFGTLSPFDDSLLGHEQAAVKQDIEHIRSRLFEAVWSPKKIVEMSCQELLRALGWSDLFRLTRKHEFPVDDETYRPITDTAAAINNAITCLAGGYLVVLGSPGSGKSTLLTHLLRYRPERVVRYYAYVPSSAEPLALRGESVSFLHDLVTELSEAGVPARGGASSLADRIQLQETLHEQLQVLGRDFPATGRKTIILVDGLDHVPREYQPDRSFLFDLPLPSAVPAGVLFVLGSQTDELADLPRAIRESVQTPDRRVEVGRLDRSAVYEIIERALPARNLSDEQKETLHRLCDGHPLALRYLLNRLAPSDDIDLALQEATEFQSNIAGTYAAYWLSLQTEQPAVAHLLALICRMQPPIDMKWVASWNDDAVVRALTQLAGHYFRRESDTRWYVFHNSFRVYVQQESAKSALGSFDASRDRNCHRELADAFASRGTSLRHRLRELYHRAMQGDCHAVAEMSQQLLFRNMIYAGLPLRRVLEAIHLGIRAAGRLQDARALIRLALSLKEISQRHEDQDEEAVIDILMGLAEYDAVIEHLRDGPRLIGAYSTGLQCSLRLLDAGRIAEAKSLFDLAEPIDVLSRSVRIERFGRQHDKNAMDNWASAAVHFRGARATLGIIGELQIDTTPDLSGTSPEQFLADIRNRMKLEAGEELLDGHEWADYRLVRDALDPRIDQDRPYWLRLTIDAIREASNSVDTEVAKCELATLTRAISPAACDDLTRTAIAECIYRIGNDADMALRWIVGLPQPSLVDSLHDPHARDLSPWRQRIRLNSLLYALTENHSGPIGIVPDSADLTKPGSVAFERAICHLAYLRGRRWRGDVIRREGVDQEVLGLLRFYYRDWHQTRGWHDWYYIQNARTAFYRELTAEISQHGHGCLEQLMSVVDREWAGANAHYWPLDVRRAIVLEALEHGMQRYWVTQQLEALDDQVEGLDVNGRRQHYAEQARAWLAVGDSARARACLERMRKCAIGVGYRKDYQANVWIRRLREHLLVKPEDASRLIPWMARAIVTLEDTTERAAIEAAQELVEVTFGIGPRNAVRLAQWFGERGIRGWHHASLEALGCAAAESPLNSADLLLAVCVDMFMPLSTYVAAERVPKKTGNYIFKHLPREQALQLLDGIASASDVLSVATERHSWKHELDQAIQKVGLPARYTVDAPEEELSSTSPSGHANSISPPRLRLKDGGELSEDEVTAGCAMFEGMLKLLQQSVDEVYSYGWDSLIRPRIDQLDRQQLLLLVEPLRAKSLTSLLVRIAHRLCELGDLTSAGGLAEEVLKSPLRFSDEWEDERGGASAIAALRKVDPARARAAAFEAVVREMTQHSYVGFEVATRSPAVMRLLDTNLLPETLWPEIEEHLHAMFDETDVQLVPAPNLVWNEENDTAQQALVDLLVAHACHPCNEVRLAAMRGLARTCKSSCAEAIASIGRALSGPERQQWHLIRLVEALSLDAPESVGTWKSDITSLGAHPNYAIREMSRSICTRLGWAVPPPPTMSELPAGYRLWLPDDFSGAPIVDGPPAPGQVLPDTDNPAVMIRPFHVEAKILAKTAQLEPNAVFARMATLMRAIEPQNTWTADAEKHLLEELQHAGPEFPYARLRAEVARRALFHVAAELADAGRAGPPALNALFRYARPHDPRMLLQYGSSRPETITIPPERKYPETVEQWRLEAGPDVCLAQLNGLVVLAEDSQFKSLGDDHLEERRQSSVMPTDEVDATTGRSVGLWRRLHEVVLGGTVGNYRNLDGLPKSPVIGNRFDGCDSPGCEWLAVNPAMADYFGWQYAGGHWFRWVDGNDNTMVMSSWWQDGLLAQIARVLHCWVGEGWIVLASPSAVQQIEDELGPLSRVSCVTRGAEREQDGHTAVKITRLGE